MANLLTQKCVPVKGKDQVVISVVETGPADSDYAYSVVRSFLIGPSMTK